MTTKSGDLPITKAGHRACGVPPLVWNWELSISDVDVPLVRALLILSYYTMDTNPTLVREARRRPAHVLADQGATV
jgi:hypothetical protein